MAAKVWRTLEELNADHERLCGEVEKLKKEFEDHYHDPAGAACVGASRVKKYGPEKCVDCGAILTGKEKVVCRDCIRF